LQSLFGFRLSQPDSSEKSMSFARTEFDWTSPGKAVGNESAGSIGHFQTGHLEANLRQRAFSSGIVTTAAQMAFLALQIVSVMILSRLLTAADFGLVAMATSATGFISVFKDGGLSTVTIQKKSISHREVSTLFWINVTIGICLTLVVAALSPFLVWIF